MSRLLDHLTASDDGRLYWKGEPVRTEARFGVWARAWAVFVAVLGVVGVAGTLMANLDRIDANWKRFACEAPGQGFLACAR